MVAHIRQNQGAELSPFASLLVSCSPCGSSLILENICRFCQPNAEFLEIGKSFFPPFRKHAGRSPVCAKGCTPCAPSHKEAPPSDCASNGGLCAVLFHALLSQLPTGPCYRITFVPGKLVGRCTQPPTSTRTGWKWGAASGTLRTPRTLCATWRRERGPGRLVR